jgi:hypothetical protein
MWMPGTRHSGGGFLVCAAYSLVLLPGNIKSDHEFKPGTPIPFGGELCPVKRYAARIVVNRS